MSYEPRLITPFVDSGLKQYFRPFLIGSTAFPDIQDAYPWRGNVKKREGYTLFKTLFNSSGITVLSITPGNPTLVTTTAPHGLSSSDLIVITGVTGTMDNSINSLPFSVTVTGLDTFTIDLDTTGLTYTAGGLINLVDKPVQGIKTWINPASLVNSSVVFSRTKSYVYNPVSGNYEDITFLAFGGPGQTNPGTAFSWTNTANDYFWTSNFAGSMWTTNNLTADHIRFWNGTNGSLNVSGGWSIHQPTVNGTNTLDAALIILPYKGRLVALNTTENIGGSSTKFSSRARWSQLGSPYTSNSAAVNITKIIVGPTTTIEIGNTTSFTIGLNAGFTNIIGSVGSVLNQNQFKVLAINAGVSITVDANTTGLVYTSGGTVQGPGSTSPPSQFSIDIFGWRDDIAGKGGFNDADTSERIVSAEIIKDTLIVAFQRSTWRLRYTGNEILPFIWERLNTQYGAESTYSNVAFDEAALFFSRYGWIASDTNDVSRIDLDIPDVSFSVEANDSSFTGLSRIQGIRDYYRQFAYWTFEPIARTSPTQIYAYNYIDKSWSVFNPSVPIRVFGTYFVNDDKTWANYNRPGDIWSNFTDDPGQTWTALGSGQNTGFPFILGGDADGNIYTMFEFINQVATDDGTDFGFNILTKRFNPYLDKGMKCRVGYVDMYCTAIPGGEITFNHYLDDQSSPSVTKIVPTFARGVINISAISTGLTTQITTSEDHNLQLNQLVTIGSIIGDIGDLLNNGSFVVTSVIDTLNFVIAVDTNTYTYGSGGYIYSGILDQGNVKYIRIYLGAIAHMHQFSFTLNDEQIADPVKGAAQFNIQALVIWTRPCGRIRG